MNEKFLLYYAANKRYFRAACAVVILAVAILLFALGSKQTVLRGAYLYGSDTIDAEAFQPVSRGFVKSLGLNPGNARIRMIGAVVYQVNPETPGANFDAIEALVEYTGKGYLDFLVGDAAIMEDLAYSEFFMDLREVLPQEQLAALEGHLLYVDQAVIRQLEEMAISQEYPEDFTLPDPASPQLMAEPVPIFLDVSENEILKSLFPEGAVFFGVAQNTERPATAREFIKYLLQVEAEME